MSQQQFKPTICLDFDGVLHSYTSGWQGPYNIPDQAVPGSIHFLLRLLIADQYKISIFSSRSKNWRGRRAMRKWLAEQAKIQFNLDFDRLPIDGGYQDQFKLWGEAGYALGMDPPDEEAHMAGRWLVRQIDWPRHKPPAKLSIDDRAMCFTGTFPSHETIDQFQPWMKQFDNKHQLLDYACRQNDEP